MFTVCYFEVSSLVNSLQDYKKFISALMSECTRKSEQVSLNCVVGNWFWFDDRRVWDVCLKWGGGGGEDYVTYRAFVLSLTFDGNQFIGI